MTLTKTEHAARRNPHKVKGRWFYLDTGYGARICSFHSEDNQNVYIPAAALMRALQRTGLLRQWDQKQQFFRKVEP